MTAVFRGWEKVSVLEYPGRVATVVFTGGCNLRCPYCYNPDLVLTPDRLPEHSAQAVIAWLKSRAPRVSAVVVTGGEPTIHAWLGAFLREAGEAGLARSLSTNGTRPEILESLLEEALVDRVTLDVKTVLEPVAYAAVTGVADPTTAERVRRSFGILRAWGQDYEVRCTVVAGFHDAATLRALAAQLQGARRLVFQTGRAGGTLDSSCRFEPAMDPAVLEAVRREAETQVQACAIRA